MTHYKKYNRDIVSLDRRFCKSQEMQENTEELREVNLNTNGW